MEIGTVLIKKKKLEKGIEDCLAAFEVETGLSIHSLGLTRSTERKASHSGFVTSFEDSKVNISIIL